VVTQKTPPKPEPKPEPRPPAKQAAEPDRAQQQQAQRDAERAAREREAQRRAEQQRQAQQRERERQAQLEAERQRNIERMLGQANATGSSSATGQAAQSSGPSASYAGRLVATIRPNIVFTDVVAGNPRAEVELRAGPDGTILSSRLRQSSGSAAWDQAVLRAIERTGKLPLDENGRVPSSLILGFRPLD
jgi:colicin import membrane protein